MKKLGIAFLSLILSVGLSAQDKRYLDRTLPIDTRVSCLLEQMTLQEKVAQMRHIHVYNVMTDGKLDKQKLDVLIKGGGMGFIEAITLSGKECLQFMNEVQTHVRNHTRLGIPIFTVSESLHGSVHDGSTIFPQSIALGSTFNTALAYEMTSFVSEELKAQGITQTLSPVLDVCRDLRWGRVEECFSEDPFLNAQLGVAQVKGYLDHQISPMIKHFGAHGGPQGGLNLASVSCGEREVLTVYLKPFEEVIKKATPWAVMSSYNSWNYQPNSSSSYLLTDLLRDKWGFQGYVYSDWGAIGMLRYFHKSVSTKAEAAIAALMAGLDAEASDDCYIELTHLVEQGYVDIKYIDRAVARILKAKFAMGLFEYELPTVTAYDKKVHRQEHVELARKIAEESIVLLKNEANLLPLDLKQIKSMAIIGPNADQVQFGDYTWSRDNKDGITLLAALQARYGNHIKINYAQGCDWVTDDRSGISQAVKVASECDVNIVVIGSASASLGRDYSNATCGEGFDLSQIELTGVQEELVKAVYQTGKPTVVVLLAGKPFAIPWIQEHIPSVLVQWYPGEQGGEALADVLFGKINPSGKLNYSFPRSTGNMPCYYNYLPTDKGYYRSPGTINKPGKDYVFDKPVSLWPFGHGLSYTQFDYLSVELSKTDYQPTDTIHVTLSIANTGDRDGYEVPQIYVRDVVSSIVTPVKELKGFAKVWLKKGETKKVQIAIPVSELALYNKEMQRVVEPGEFELQIGSSSVDIRLKKKITVQKDQMKVIPTFQMKQAIEKGKGDVTNNSPMKVKGEVRDVQSNLLADVVIKVKDKQVKTTVHGDYVIEVYPTDTLEVFKKGYAPQFIPVDNQREISIRLLRE
jgi:beta-glucosidase